MTDSASRRTVLVTGVTGFLGKLLLETLLRRRSEIGVERVFALIRPQRGVSAHDRFQQRVAGSASLAKLPADWTRHVTVLEGDLEAPACGLSREARAALLPAVTHVLHAAASVEFELPLEAAVSANATTALNVLELARCCERLESLVCVSTAYVTPHPGDGVPIEERLAPLPRPASEIYASVRVGKACERELLDHAGHPNTYTFTKCLAEHLLVERRGDVPLSIVRPSIISAAWRHPLPGWIDSQAAFAAFVALVGSGHLRAMVGDPTARLDLVPVDWVAERILEAADEPATDGAVRIRHAVAGWRRSPEIGECRRRILGYFRANRVGRRPRVPYVGPAGLRFRLADGLHNRAPVHLAQIFSKAARRRGARLLRALDDLNRIFPYFTQRSFDFQTTRPLDDPRFDHRAYVSLVCEGVHRHLLQRTT